MADNKKYYYLKIKENFFESDELILLQNMQDGYLYSDILMKLYLRSLKNNGKLMFKDVIPYTPEALAQVVRHQVGTVKQALEIFKQLGLIEILDNGAIYMLDIQTLIGESSTEADRKRAYRTRIANEKELKLTENTEKGQMVGQMSSKCPDKSTPEIDIEIDIDIDKEIYKKKILKEKAKNLIENYQQINSDENLKQKVYEWLIYKQEKKQSYKDTGLKSLLKKINEYAIKYGNEAMIQTIDDTMASNYDGIIYNKLEKNNLKTTSNNPFLDIAREEGIL